MIVIRYFDIFIPNNLIIYLFCFFSLSKMGHFLVALRAFDVLEKLDKSPEYWEGKRGAAAGVLQMIVNKHDPM